MLKLEDIQDGDVRQELDLYLTSNYSLGQDSVHVHGIETDEDGELIVHFDEGDENVKTFPLTTPLPPRTFALMYPDAASGDDPSES